MDVYGEFATNLGLQKKPQSSLNQSNPSLIDTYIGHRYDRDGRPANSTVSH